MFSMMVNRKCHSIDHPETFSYPHLSDLSLLKREGRLASGPDGMMIKWFKSSNLSLTEVNRRLYKEYAREAVKLINRSCF